MVLCSVRLVAQRLPFYNLNIEQGLIQSQATSLAQDDGGHLWIGTLGGLSRWDGRQFVSYTVRDGLPSNTILSLQSGAQHSLWIGTSKGLTFYDGHTFRNYTFSSPDNPQGNTVTAIAVKDAATWCIAGGQLYQIADKKVRAMPLPDAGLRCTALMYDRDTALWAGTAQGQFYCYQNDSWGAKMSSGRGAQTVFSFFQDTSGRSQTIRGIVTDRGIQRYGYNGFLYSAWPAKQNAELQIRAGVQSDAKSIWFAAVSGAYFLNGGTYTHYGRKEGLTDSRINAVFADREGNVWFASDGQGVYRYSGAPFSILDEASGVNSNEVSSFARGPDGTLYLGTYNAGINRYRNGVLSTMPFPKGLTAGTMATALGKVWVGTRGSGLYYLSGNQWVHYAAQPFAGIISLRASPEGNLWIGANAGAAILSADSLHVISHKLSGVTDFLPVGSDSVLISTANGLLLYNQSVLSPFITGGPADSATVQCMVRRGNTLFFGSSDNGIIIYNTALHKSTSIGKDEGLHSEFIYNLTLDDTDDLWAGTGFGIHRIHFSKNGYSIAFYGQEAGLKGMESNHNAALKLPDGSIWFGTTGGAVHYQPSLSAELRSTPVAAISSVLLFGKEIKDTTYFKSGSPFYGVPQALRLPYRENNLTFTFSGILLSGSPLQYRYWLSGTDAQWSAWSAISTVNFSAMAPGKYVLRVQCRSSDGRVGSAVPYAFEIITPFHKTSLFRLLVLAGCILLGIALQYYAARRRLARERLIEKLRREEQAIVRERTAEDFHDEVGNKITRINVMASVLKSRLGAPSADVLRMIESIQDNAGQLYQGTRDILWSLKPSNDSLYENVNRIIHFGQDLFGDTDVVFTAGTPDEGWKNLRLPMDASRNLIMIFKEALNNVLKHSGATNVLLEAALDKDLLQMILRDNGKGFDIERIARGHGLDNMQNRAKRLNGGLSIHSGIGGTTYTLSAKFPQLKG